MLSYLLGPGGAAAQTKIGCFHSHYQVEGTWGPCLPLRKPIAELTSPATAGGKCSGWWLWPSANMATSWWWCLPGPWSMNLGGRHLEKSLTRFHTFSLIYWELEGAVVADW